MDRLRAKLHPESFERRPPSVDALERFYRAAADLAANVIDVANTMAAIIANASDPLSNLGLAIEEAYRAIPWYVRLKWRIYDGVMDVRHAVYEWVGRNA